MYVNIPFIDCFRLHLKKHCKERKAKISMEPRLSIATNHCTYIIFNIALIINAGNTTVYMQYLQYRKASG